MDVLRGRAAQGVRARPADGRLQSRPTCSSTARPQGQDALAAHASGRCSTSSSSATGASQRGGVIVRTDAGDVDATLDSQLERLREVLLGPDATCSTMPDAGVSLALYAQRLRRADPYRVNGRVVEVIGLVIESPGPEAEVGEICLRRASPRRDAGARRGRRLPRGPHAADAARRPARHPPRRRGRRDRSHR